MSTLSEVRQAEPLTVGDGAAPARRRAERVDTALAELASGSLEPAGGLAVVAVGGYGRGELSPHSDVDLLFVATRRGIGAAVLRNLLYPLWDAGFEVGHALRSPKEAILQAADDLDAATSLLHARFVAGDHAPFEELVDRRRTWIRKDRRRLTRSLLHAAAARHIHRDRAGWALAPDLKDDVGGMRDVHTLLWLEAVTGTTLGGAGAREPAALLMAVREALHGQSRRKNDRLRIDLQPEVAARLEVDLDDLMASVHSAARAVEHAAARGREEAARHVFGGPRRSGAARPVGDGVMLQDGTLVARAGARPLDILAAYAHTGRPPALETLDVLDAGFGGSPLERWDGTERSDFLRLLRGDHAPAALELLDRVGGFTKLLPEWRGVRGRAQHDPYHRYTVDGHTFLAVGEVTRALVTDPLAAAAREEIGELDALYIATLLHDIGKGSGEDHSVAGAAIARRACHRIGLDTAASGDVAALVRHHLLLSDTATRRDLDDGTVIENVVETTRSARRLKMLYILTVADGRATGPRAWNDWKATLVRELFTKTLMVFETGELPVRKNLAVHASQIEAYEPRLAGRSADLLARMPESYPDSLSVADLAEELRLLSPPPGAEEVRHRVEHHDGRAFVTVCVRGRPGALARTAGAFTLSRMPILRAQTCSSSDGVALQRFVVDPPAAADWKSFAATLVDAYAGRLALEHEVERKIADYRQHQQISPEVRILESASHSATVIEVRAQDAVGLLYAAAAALGDLDLDIHVAKIDTVGERVVDVFYVRNAAGAKLHVEQAAAAERAIVHRIARLLA